MIAEVEPNEQRGIARAAADVIHQPVAVDVEELAGSAIDAGDVACSDVATAAEDAHAEAAADRYPGAERAGVLQPMRIRAGRLADDIDGLEEVLEQTEAIHARLRILPNDRRRQAVTGIEPDPHHFRVRIEVDHIGQPVLIDVEQLSVGRAHRVIEADREAGRHHGARAPLGVGVGNSLILFVVPANRDTGLQPHALLVDLSEFSEIVAAALAGNRSFGQFP